MNVGGRWRGQSYVGRAERSGWSDARRQYLVAKRPQSRDVRNGMPGSWASDGVAADKTRWNLLYLKF